MKCKVKCLHVLDIVRYYSAKKSFPVLIVISVQKFIVLPHLRESEWSDSAASHSKALSPCLPFHKTLPHDGIRHEPGSNVNLQLFVGNTELFNFLFIIG